MAFAAPESAAAPAVAAARVAQRGRRFDPGRVVIEAGTLLEISNDEAATVHNVRIDDARMRIDSGVQDPGETVAIAFPEPGTYRAFCAIHTRMRLEVEVRPQAARIR
jgi:cytochrome c peroxidase